ncbi:MAG: hypothetical protein ACXWZ4_17110, partial [Gemmatirosa sp.]
MTSPYRDDTQLAADATSSAERHDASRVDDTLNAERSALNAQATRPLGRIVATERKPNTAFEFHFWTSLDSPVGVGTIVRVQGAIPVDGQLPQVY